MDPHKPISPIGWPGVHPVHTIRRVFEEAELAAPTAMATVACLAQQAELRRKAIESSDIQPIHNVQTPAVPEMTQQQCEHNQTLLLELRELARIWTRPTLAGLAANQMGLRGERIMLRACFINTRDRWLIALNPVIDELDGGTIIQQEGCLTWPGRKVEAKRWDRVKLTFRNLEWQECWYEASGFDAQVWQHEINHLNGVEERIIDPASMPQAGRNDPCPCGSGRKFKRCCGR